MMQFDWTNNEAETPEVINPWSTIADEDDQWATKGFDEHAGDEQEDDIASMAPTVEEISCLMAKLSTTPQVMIHPSKHDSRPHRAQAVATCEIAPSRTLQSLDPDLREAFLDDARSCISSMESALLKLESDPRHTESLNQIGRELHTLKRASASVGLTELADQLHQLEDMLSDDVAAARTPCFDSLLKSVDSIRSQITSNQQTPAQQVSDAACTSITSAPTAFSDDASDDETVRVKSSQLNRLMDMLAELVMLRNRRETELSRLQEVYHELIGSVSKMRLLSNEGDQPASASSSLQLSEIANDVLEVAQSVRDCARPVAEGNIAVSQFIRQFRQELVELRRTPVAGLFQRLQRVVRDAAQAESKAVQLILVGEDAGIERTLQQRLYEPLLHIVRNSVCHGIENSETRIRNGKPGIGTITLEAKSGPDLFVIEIRDDGNGLDYDAIRRRGLESGLLDAGQSASRQELSQLIFHPGFSTRQTANQVAGRGVGMDVVAATLQRMRGWLEIDSEPQQGTRIRLSFPLPSVIQHAMVFRCADQLFALPMQSVRSVGEAAKSDIYLDFSRVMGDHQSRTIDAYQKIVLAADASVSLASGGKNVTLLVDEIIGPEEVVVRPLPALLKTHPFCSGATLSGMGRTVIVLDARHVIDSQQHLIQFGEPSTEVMLVGSANSLHAGSTRPRVLVVDDSLSARKRVVRSLQRYAIEIIEASDGKEALELLKTSRFAAVFSDLEMPHINGLELLAEINSSDADGAPPVIIISSRSEHEFTSRATELGVSSYLIKPLADEALDQALAKIPTLTLSHVNSSSTR